MLENTNQVLKTTNGILCKSHPKSKFIYRDMDNGLFELDAINPCICNNDSSVVIPIVVLQIMLCDAHNVLIEFVCKDEF